jgi:hypothetical protein
MNLNEWKLGIENEQESNKQFFLTVKSCILFVLFRQFGKHNAAGILFGLRVENRFSI